MRYPHPSILPVVLLSFYFLIATPGFTQDECLECHSESDLTMEDASGNEISIFVDGEKYLNSIHGEFACADCHVDATEIPHEEDLAPVDCGMCHDDVQEEYATSVHGRAHAQGIAEAANCADCHGRHDILSSSDIASRTHPLNQAETCALCHSNPEIVQKFSIPVGDPLSAYRQSVHGVAIISERNFDAATCSSCHGAHNIRAMDDEKSPIFWRNVPETCGQCHGEVYEEYTEGIHWQAAKKGVRDAPVCTDCHGEHEVRSPSDPRSYVHPLRVANVTCERCHSSERITGRYGLSVDNVATFQDSYHGLAIKAGSLSAANCASCHGIHRILPSSDPRSTVYPANLKNTCGKCHPDITENVVRGAVHLTTSTTPGRIVEVVKNIYIMLIVVVIGFMVIHNGADFLKKSKQIIRKRGER